MPLTDNRDEFFAIAFSSEIEKMAIRLAAYEIMKELEQGQMISEEELFHIREKYQIPVE